MGSFALSLVVLGVLLFFASDTLASWVSLTFAIIMLVAICLMISAPSPRHSFWIGFLILSLGMHYLDDPQRSFMSTLPRFSHPTADLIYDYFLPINPNIPGLYFYTARGHSAVWYQEFDQHGKRKGIGAMSPTDKKLGGIDVSTIPVAPDSVAFEVIIREYFAMLFGILGGWLTYRPDRSRQNYEPLDQ
ncbi:hypothetical protein Pan54_08970 [Rubinisphaera italica]|uniref:Uncharacterized protein n=2 Tax=Rubinisphaera italica TaxID=2527969 RepID=A0A5C5XCZ6_9PLAN|nr:hypothetical protein Pan54_08970 [Rubinisphaera italica]